MTKLKEMKPGVRYKVITNGDTLKIGDSISIDGERTLSLHCFEGGWLDSHSWSRLRNKVEIDMEHYKNMETKAVDKLEVLRKLICELEVKHSVDKAKRIIDRMPK